MGFACIDTIGRGVRRNASPALAVFTLLSACGGQLHAEAAPDGAAKDAARPQPSIEIDAYDVDGNTILDQDTVEGAVYPFLGPGRVRKDIDDARDALEKAYRARGYSSVVVELPAQDARSGVIRLHVVEAPVGRLRVVGSQYTSLEHIKQQVPSIAPGKVPDFREAQKEIAAITGPADLRVTPIIKAGKTPGTVDIDLKVTDSLPAHASVELNNDHTQGTTQLRTVAQASYGNLWQMGHTLSATVILAPENLKNAEVFLGSYSAPIWDTPWTAVLSGNTSNSNVPTLGGTGVIGKGFTIGAHGKLQLPPLDDFTEGLDLGIDYKHYIQNIVLGSGHTDSSIDYAPLSASYSVYRQAQNSFLSGSLGLTLGLRGLGSGVAGFFQNRADAKADFVRVNLDLQGTQNLPYDLQFAARISAQYSDQPLLPNEQFAAGGLQTLRGYLQSEAIGDDGADGSFDLSAPSLAPFVSSLVGDGYVDDWRFYAFSDSAIAWVLKRLPEQKSEFRLASFGLGTKLQLLSHFTGNVAIGMPMLDGPATKAWHPYTEFTVKAEL